MSEAKHYKLGLIHDHAPPAVPDLATFASTPIPAPPSGVKAPQVVWPMADNNALGDCTIAGAVHVNQVGTAITHEPWDYPGDQAVQDTYFGLSGGQDTGLLLPQVLEPWHQTGLWGQKNGGYALVRPKNTTGVKQAIWIFGNVYVAVDLPAVAQRQFQPNGTGVWQLTHTSADYDIEGGHCIVGVGYSQSGVVCVTWGGTVLVTWEWWGTYVVQAYAVVPPAFEGRGGDGRGFNLHAIDNWLAKV